MLQSLKSIMLQIFETKTKILCYKCYELCIHTCKRHIKCTAHMTKQGKQQFIHLQ